VSLGREAKSYKISLETDPEIKQALAPYVNYLVTQAQANGQNTTTEEIYATYLYESLQYAKDLGQNLYFAPRTWPEAGLVEDIQLEQDGQNWYVNVIIPKQIGNFYQGVKRFAGLGEDPFDALRVCPFDIAENSTIYPRGAVFTTPQIDLNPKKAFMLSCVNDFTYEDEYQNVMTKEGVAKHAIVLYAQNNYDLKLNAFGRLAYTTTTSPPSAVYNLNFEYFPYQPFFCLLRKDHYDSTTTSRSEFRVYTYGAIRKTARFFVSRRTHT
jgi:hypothetical protein